MKMAMACAHLLISGLVQGVFYRASAQEEGLRLGLRGWVRNVSTGDVEAEVEGPEEAIDRFIEWCKTGPRGAEVSDVKVTRKPHQDHYKTFTILR